MKVCKDGRIWGQNNKEASDHLGILTGRKPQPCIKKGYNLNSKGRPFKKGHKDSEETRKKKSLSHMGLVPWNKGRKCPEISKAKKGYCPTQETREKLRKAAIKRGAKPPSALGRYVGEETRKKLSKINKGKKLSEKQKRKISEARKGVIPWNKGRKGIYSKQTLEKMSKARKAITKKGEEHHLYTNGHGRHYPYPEGWTVSLKESIRQRDNYKCQLCGAPQEEFEKKLPVHHKDCNIENLDPENLITLCQRCHIIFHNKLRYLQGRVKCLG